MARKRKGRCVKKNQQVQSEPDEVTQAPHSFIIHRGLPGGNLVDLTKDFRKVMEPFTAAKLKERKKNTIKDFVSIAGVFHVSHMCIFSRTELGMYLKIGKLPRGPTLSFKIHNFSLARDVVSTLKKQLVFNEAFKHPPLIILNSFSGEGMHMKLMASTFQNMFPPINLTNVNLSTLRRCVLLNYNPTAKLIDFRHYAVKVIPIGISKGVKKFVQGKVPNLARCNDIADFLTKAPLLSESEVEDDPSSHVTLPQKLSSRGNLESGQSAIRLSELGPRLTMQLMKIEDGLLDGEVLFHEIVSKTDEEKLIIQKKREEKRKLKEKRKKLQEGNLKNKELRKDELKKKSLEGMQKKKNMENDTFESVPKETVTENNIEVDDDAEYYRQEVGEEPDEELFSSQNRKRKFPVGQDYKNKKSKTDYEEKNRFNKGKRFNDKNMKNKTTNFSSKFNPRKSVNVKSKFNKNKKFK